MSPRYPNVTVSTHELIVRYVSNNFRFIILIPQITTRRPQSFNQRKDNKNVHQPLCIDYPKVTSGIRKLSSITYIKWIKIIPHCHHGYSYARHISCVLRYEHSIRQDKTSKGKDSIHHNKSREGRNIIWSICVNKAHDTSRSWHLKNTREGD